MVRGRRSRRSRFWVSISCGVILMSLSKSIISRFNQFVKFFKMRILPEVTLDLFTIEPFLFQEMDEIIPVQRFSFGIRGHGI